VLVASVLWYCWLGAVLGFCWQKPVSVRREVETSSNWFKPKRPKIVVHWYCCCDSNRISTVSYKTNTVTYLCILSHTSCCVKCVSTQMKTAREAKIRLWKMTLLNITIITQRCNSLTFLCYSWLNTYHMLCHWSLFSKKWLGLSMILLHLMCFGKILQKPVSARMV